MRAGVQTAWHAACFRASVHSRCARPARAPGRSGRLTTRLRRMRPVLPLVLAALIVASWPALAADTNFNTQSSSTTNSTTANCNASFMLYLCASTTTETAVAAPLPALGSGLVGSGALAAASALAVVLRRRRLRAAR